MGCRTDRNQIDNRSLSRVLLNKDCLRRSYLAAYIWIDLARSLQSSHLLRRKCDGFWEDESRVVFVSPKCERLPRRPPGTRASRYVRCEFEVSLNFPRKGWSHRKNRTRCAAHCRNPQYVPVLSVNRW